MITLKEVLEKMDERDKFDNPIPFSITFCTYSRFKNTGGDRISIDEAVKVVGKRKDKTIIDNRNSGPKAISKNPNHYKNHSRNIMIVSSKQIRKIHIRLIEKFNGLQVTY